MQHLHSSGTGSRITSNPAARPDRRSLPSAKACNMSYRTATTTVMTIERRFALTYGSTETYTDLEASSAWPQQPMVVATDRTDWPMPIRCCRVASVTDMAAVARCRVGGHTVVALQTPREAPTGTSDLVATAQANRSTRSAT